MAGSLALLAMLALARALWPAMITPFALAFLIHFTGRMYHHG